MAGDIEKVTYPLSSILKILAPKVNPAIPYSNVATLDSASNVQFIGTCVPTITKASLPYDLQNVTLHCVANISLRK